MRYAHACAFSGQRSAVSGQRSAVDHAKGTAVSLFYSKAPQVTWPTANG
ncbi:MAG: hypothetical protein F6J90_28290 [Moorea sp. SIOASIH]|nr:hypothetical protein [Moorena sp. SIOASIH]NEO40023.1 hypothetical protein [Moorena sp. SIOASIH]